MYLFNVETNQPYCQWECYNWKKYGCITNCTEVEDASKLAELTGQVWEVREGFCPRPEEVEDWYD